MLAGHGRAILAMALAVLALAPHGSRAQDAEQARTIPDMAAAAAERETMLREGRMLLAREYPEAMRHLSRNDGFGGPSSRLIANRMQENAPELVAEARAKMTIENFGREGRGLWLLRFPYVNVAVVETNDSLVVIDSGYAAIGPVLREVLPTLSPKPLGTIAISHSHVDHAYGALSLIAADPDIEVIATEGYLDEVAADIRLRGSIAKYNNQSLANQPTDTADIAMPTRTFRDALDTTIGGVRFVFTHAPAETDGQHWVWLPEHAAVLSADYYQGFLPNAGNPKRRQRHVEEWAEALQAMAAHEPALLLPMHGTPIAGAGQVAAALTDTADALSHISRETVAALNAGVRKDQVAEYVTWPDRFADNPLLDPQYNRPEDIARMVANRWTGWWDDIPSRLAALAFEHEAREAVSLAGGVDAIALRARALLPDNPRLAARLADWAYFGAPDSAAAKRLFIEVYMARIAEPDMPVQESIVYLEAASQARSELAAME